MGSAIAAWFSTSAITFSNRSASAAGLSVRMRAMRGNRSATPDLWRDDNCAASNATSSTSAFSTSRTGPKRAVVWLRTQRSRNASSCIGEAEIGLADRHQLVLAPDAERVVGIIASCACRGRAARTSALRRCSAGRASISTTAPSAGPADRGCRRASASAPRSRRRARPRGSPTASDRSPNRISGDRSMRGGRMRANQSSSRMRRASKDSGRTILARPRTGCRTAGCRRAGRAAAWRRRVLRFSRCCRSANGADHAVADHQQLAVQHAVEIHRLHDFGKGRRDVLGAARIEPLARRCRDQLHADAVPLPLGPEGGGIERGEIRLLQRMRQHRRAKHRRVRRIGPRRRVPRSRRTASGRAAPVRARPPRSRRRRCRRSRPAPASPAAPRRRRAGRR